jgi:zinc transporter ZupT
VGILVHSAADGIALGAAAFAENAATGALISLAIILHKVRTRLRRHTTILPS